MKLYATVSSERASKGQGGNEYLAIQVQNEKQEKVLTILYSADGLGKMYLSKVFGEFHAIRELALKTDEEYMNELQKLEKGEKQKGEKCGHAWYGNYPCPNCPK